MKTSTYKITVQGNGQREEIHYIQAFTMAAAIKRCIQKLVGDQEIVKGELVR